MKVLLYTDVHWSKYSSIIRGRGEKYSVRLENLIKSINWAEDLSIKANCNLVVCLGDFFDASTLDSEEITALNDVMWNNCAFHYFIVGNHEMGRSDLSYSSEHIMNMIHNCRVVDKPMALRCDDFTTMWFLPYVLEQDRKPLKEYIAHNSLGENSKTIILSHNDIAGIQMGAFMSTSGFHIDEIQENCDLFLNGHLHNGTVITNGIINLGNLTGQNFSEDATRYNHSAFILDTDTLELQSFENPFAFNFYKIENADDITNKLNKINFKPNSVVCVKAYKDDLEAVKGILENNSNIIEKRIIVVPKEVEVVESEYSVEDLAVDHLKTFAEYMLNNFPNTDILENELYEVCK